MVFGVLRSVFATQELGLFPGLMAERGLRLRQGLDEALEGWDESGAEESDDDSDGGESEIEQREEECHTRLILIESECGFSLLFLCPLCCARTIDFCVLIVSIIHRSFIFSLFFCKIKFSYGSSLVNREIQLYCRSFIQESTIFES